MSKEEEGENVLYGKMSEIEKICYNALESVDYQKFATELKRRKLLLRNQFALEMEESTIKSLEYGGPLRRGNKILLAETIEKVGNSAPVQTHTSVVHIPSRKEVLVVGGLKYGGTSTDSIYSFDLMTKKWTFMTSLPEDRYYCTSSIREGEISQLIVFGGFSSSGVNSSDVFIYDLSSKKWDNVLFYCDFKSIGDFYPGESKVMCLGDTDERDMLVTLLVPLDANESEEENVYLAMLDIDNRKWDLIERLKINKGTRLDCECFLRKYLYLLFGPRITLEEEKTRMEQGARSYLTFVSEGMRLERIDLVTRKRELVTDDLVNEIHGFEKVDMISVRDKYILFLNTRTMDEKSDNDMRDLFNSTSWCSMLNIDTGVWRRYYLYSDTHMLHVGNIIHEVEGMGSTVYVVGNSEHVDEVWPNMVAIDISTCLLDDEIYNDVQDRVELLRDIVSHEEQEKHNNIRVSKIRLGDNSELFCFSLLL